MEDFMREAIEVRAPYDFRRMLTRIQSRPTSLTWVDMTAGQWARVLYVEGEPVPVRVSFSGTVEKPRLLVESPIVGNRQALILAEVRRLLSVEVPLEPFLAQAALRPEWITVLSRWAGYRVILDGDPFESLVRTVIGQQIHVAVAAKLVDRLVVRAGRRITFEDISLGVFPRADTLRHWSSEEWTALGFSAPKARYLTTLAAVAADEGWNGKTFQEMSDDAVMKRLLPLPGIGRWTAECFLIFGLGRLDVVPAGDLGLQRALQRLYGWSQKPSESEVREVLAPFQPWRSLATLYLWQSLLP
ncbi:putative DNA-3-methyladenine glycosylase II [Sulfobacillus acidophilus TPY]|nr:putative DNA-3-methyladenine glycosylase II [Sulfobacillus acidophilus TPY]